MFDPVTVKNNCVKWIYDFEENGKGRNAVVGFPAEKTAW